MRPEPMNGALETSYDVELLGTSKVFGTTPGGTRLNTPDRKRHFLLASWSQRMRKDNNAASNCRFRATY